MKYHTVKRLAAVSAVALALVFGAHEANAQTTAQIGSSFATAAALASAPVSDIDFGTWVINLDAAEDATLTLGADIGAPPPDATVGGVTAASVVVNTVDSANSGQVTVTAPIATDLEIQGVVSTDYPDVNLSLGGLTFPDFNTSDAALPVAYNGTLITVQAANTAETIAIGGVLTITDNPAEATAFTGVTGAVVDISFRY